MVKLELVEYPFLLGLPTIGLNLALPPGALEGAPEGVPEGATEGVPEGATEGATGGVTEGTTEGSGLSTMVTDYYQDMGYTICKWR